VLLPELIGDSPGVALLREQVSRLLGRSAPGGRLPPTLIVGETGTGKGLLAQALHAASARHDLPFVDLNCAAIPESLLEAELFGVERGAFTGADRARPGLFQAAHRGTLFLDEVALLPSALQSKLLKALEDGAVRRVGSTRREAVDAWILAATNEELDEAMSAGRFRRDLYHRLSVVTLRLPPRRERGDDAVRLAEHFLAHSAGRYGTPALTLADDARAALRAYDWPGNVRELANLIERVTLLSRDPVVTASLLELPERSSGADREPAGRTKAPAARSAGTGDAATERERLLAALEETGWNLSRAAARLELPRNTVRYRMERHGLREPPPSRRTRARRTEDGSTPRRLTLLRIVLSRPGTTDGDGDASRRDELLATVAAKIRAFGGRAEEITADAVVAAFGVEPIEDASVRAALAALAALAAARHEWRGASPLVASAAIDLHDCGVVLPATGRAAGEIDATSRAAAWPRLEALVASAPPGAVIVGDAAAVTLRRRFALSPPATSDGGGATVQRILGPERTGFAPDGRVAELVGRGHELALLESRVAALRGGRGQVTSLVGDAGIGKSRLLFELRRRLPADVTYLEARCASYAATTPYFVVQELVREAAGVGERDDPGALGGRLRRLLDALEVPDALAPYLLAVGVGAVDVASSANPALAKARTLEAARHLVLALARRRPLVLAIEDLHWIDRSSGELLTTLVDAIAGVPVLLVATYRPGFEPAWLARVHVTQLALQPLSPDEGRTVLRAALSAAPDDALTIERLLARAEGNPLFLEELAQAERDDPAAEPRAVPATVHAVLAARIDRLDAADRDALQAAAVVGKDVPVSALEALSDEDPAALRDRLRRLQAAGLLLETMPGERAALTFKHALTQEVAYATLDPARRRQLHARAAGLERRPEAIARHLTAADLVDEAVPHWLEAGRSALWRSANTEAVSHLQAALALLRRTPASNARARMELELQLTLGPALARDYASAEAEAAYARAHALCAEIGDAKEALAGLWRIHMFQLIRGEFPAARTTAEQLLASSERVRDPDFRVEAQLALGAPLVYEGRLTEGRRHIESAIALADPERSSRHAFVYGQDPLVVALSYLGWVLVLQGEVAEARGAVERAQGRAVAIEHDYSRAFAMYLTAIVCDLSDDAALLRDVAEGLIAFSAERELPFWQVAGTALRGRALAAQGRHEEGLTLMTAALDLARAASAGSALVYFARNVADAYLAIGARDDAMRAVTEGLAVCERQDYRIGESDLHRIRAEVLTADPASADEAEESFRRAIAIARAQGAQYYLRRAGVALATHLRRRGREAEAEQVLAGVR